MYTMIMLIIYGIVVFIVNGIIVLEASEEGKFRRNLFLCLMIVSGFALLGAITIVDYTSLSQLIKSVLSEQQISFIRSLFSFLTNGGSVLVFIETTVSQIVSVVFAVGVVLGVSAAYNRFFACRKYVRLRRQHNTHYIPLTSDESTVYPLRFIRLNR